MKFYNYKYKYNGIRDDDAYWDVSFVRDVLPASTIEDVYQHVDKVLIGHKASHLVNKKPTVESAQVLLLLMIMQCMTCNCMMMHIFILFIIFISIINILGNNNENTFQKY